MSHKETGGGEVGEVANLVEPGWNRSELIRNLGGPSYRLLFYPDGVVRFEHKCKVVDGVQIICAPALQLREGGHRIWLASVTVEPSISCPDCGTHGFITNARWRDA